MSPWCSVDLFCDYFITQGTSDTDAADEDSELTSLGCGVYFDYLLLGGGICGVISFFLLCIFAQVRNSELWCVKCLIVLTVLCIME